MSAPEQPTCSRCGCRKPIQTIIPLEDGLPACSACARIPDLPRKVGEGEATFWPVVITTDGSTYPNPGPGGWAAVIQVAGQAEPIEISGADPETTNNEMELMAVVRALESLERPSHILIRSDSQLVIKCATWEWGRKAEHLQALWRRYDAETCRHLVSWLWVKGHAGDERNERADYLAGQARLALCAQGGLPPGMWVTACTDAGWREDVGATWGIWLRCEAGRVVLKSSDHERLRPPPWIAGPHAAELAAIFAAVKTAVEKWKDVQGILVISDSQNALNWLRGKGIPAKGTPEARLVDLIQRTADKFNLTMRYRWVRGHQGKDAREGSTPAYLNHQVDRLATQAREEEMWRLKLKMPDE